MNVLTVNKDRFDDFADKLADRIQSSVGNEVPADVVKHIVKGAVDNHCKRKQDAHMDGMDLTMLAGEVICAIANKAGGNHDALQQVMVAVNEGIKDYCKDCE